MDIAELYGLYVKSQGIATDSRKVAAGQLFFALKGNNFNGNHYALAALGSGASHALVDEDLEAPAAYQARLIRVPDVLAAMQGLARHHRDKLGVPVLAITGSNGKTTTKELVRDVLASSYRVHSTVGNFNNHIGVPLTLLAMPPDTELAIIEMGANHQGEIDALCHIAKPSHGLVTNVGKAHLEGFGGMEGVIKGKGELYRYLASHDGVAFVNREEPHLSGMAQGCAEVVGYGSHLGRELSLSQSNPFLQVDWSEGGVSLQVSTQLVGRYNYPNILTAIAVGQYFAVPIQGIQQALEAYCPSNNRSQWMRRGSNTIVMDSYNANPTSMRAALENFLVLDAPRKVVVIGDMLEMGDDSQKEHQAIMDFLSHQNVESIYTVGAEFMACHTGHAYPDVETLIQKWDWSGYENTLFLIKGSRGMRLERLL